MAADGTVGIEAGWSDAIPSTQDNWGGSGKSEASYLEFMGFTFEARGDPNVTGTSGSKTEDDSSAGGVDVAVYTWDCPNPDRRP